MPLYLKPPSDTSPDEESTSGNIPDFDERGYLPEGIHHADWPEVEERFGWNEHRRILMKGLLNACSLLWGAGVDTLYLNGSFVTDVEIPNDYDACWDMRSDSVNFACLPEHMRIGTLRPPEQIRQFKGEFHGMGFLDLYQRAGSDLTPKGVVALNLETVPHDYQD